MSTLYFAWSFKGLDDASQAKGKIMLYGYFTFCDAGGWHWCKESHRAVFRHRHDLWHGAFASEEEAKQDAARFMEELGEHHLAACR